MSERSLTVSAETAEALHQVYVAWKRCQDICEHKDNTSGMEWCDPSHCPLLAI